MVDVLLLDELAAFLATITHDYILDTKLGQRPPSIVKGFLPPKRDGDFDLDEEFVILIRFADGESDWNVSAEEVKGIARTIIAVRTASYDVQQGPRNTLNLMQFIQRKIYEAPVLVQKYRATFPMKWKAPEGDRLPIWQGEMTIPWIVPVPQEICDFEGGEYFG